jgi:hypothetical protein
MRLPVTGSTASAPYWYALLRLTPGGKGLLTPSSMEIDWRHAAAHVPVQVPRRTPLHDLHLTPQVRSSTAGCIWPSPPARYRQKSLNRSAAISV